MFFLKVKTRQAVSSELSSFFRLSVAPWITIHTGQAAAKFEGFHLLVLQKTRIVSLLKCVLFLVLHLDYRQIKAKILYKMSVPIEFEAQVYFRGIAMLSKDVSKKEVNIT